jgi:hypothetical protein
VPAHAVALAQEARPEHVLGAAARYRLEHAGQLGGVVLAVPVEVHRGPVAALAGELEARAQRGAEPARLRVRDHPGPGPPRRGRAAVTRAVVDHDHVHRHAARVAGKPPEHVAEPRLLVPGDDDREAA